MQCTFVRMENYTQNVDALVNVQQRFDQHFRALIEQQLPGFFVHHQLGALPEAVSKILCGLNTHHWVIRTMNQRHWLADPLYQTTCSLPAQAR